MQSVTPCVTMNWTLPPALVTVMRPVLPPGDGFAVVANTIVPLLADDAPLVIVNHGESLVADQLHVDVTATDPVLAVADTNCDVADNDKAHGVTGVTGVITPFCVTTSCVAPPMPLTVMRAERGVVDVLAAAENAMAPGPDPEPPLVITSHDESLAADHEQPAVTATLDAPPAATIVCVDEDSAYVHASTRGPTTSVASFDAALSPRAFDARTRT